MKILITGATGFVGTNILNNYSKIYDFYSLNLRNPEAYLSNFNNIDCFLHFAGKAHDTKNSTNYEDYYLINTEHTKKLFDVFLLSKAKVFITLSSVKAVADSVEEILKEEIIPNPITHYGKSKLLAEKYILSREIPKGKRFYILRPCMIHGPGNKGNLNLLYSIVKMGFPWPLGAFDNKRSFCSIDNLSFIINELINNDKIVSGIYNVSDNEAISTNDIIKLFAKSQRKNYQIWNVPTFIIKFISKIGDFIKLPLNTERLNKLTENFIVSNNKIKTAINKPLPLSAKEGLMKTLNSFNTNVK